MKEENIGPDHHHHPTFHFPSPSSSSSPTPDFPSSSVSYPSPSVSNYDPIINPRKKRSKMIKIDNSVQFPRPKYTKKPDPSAPKITKPCSECGKKFWSWKALFGHMRCHPERQWRGINPPPNHRRNNNVSPPPRNADVLMTDEDHETAASLLLLANSSISDNMECDGNSNCRFECSSCKKVFGSHQALGGHRASHKNVKGCFAIATNDDFVGEGNLVEENHQNQSNVNVNNKMMVVLGGHHQCSICLRVFSSGQALGGHKRCHWEKGDETPSFNQGLNLFRGGGGGGGGGLDLNLPAPLETDPSSASAASASANSSFSNSDLALDLRLSL